MASYSSLWHDIVPFLLVGQGKCNPSGKSRKAERRTTWAPFSTWKRSKNWRLNFFFQFWIRKTLVVIAFTIGSICLDKRSVNHHEEIKRTVTIWKHKKLCNVLVLRWVCKNTAIHIIALFILLKAFFVCFSESAVHFLCLTIKFCSFNRLKIWETSYRRREIWGHPWSLG